MSPVSRHRVGRWLRGLSLSCLVLFIATPMAMASEIPEYGISWIRELGFNRVLVPRHAEQRSTPLVVSDTIHLGTRLGDVWSFDRRRGTVNWSVRLGSPVDADLSVDRNHLYAATVSGAVYALDRESGSTQWRYWAGHEVQGAPTVAGELLLFTTANNQLFALDRHTGVWQWQYSEGPDPDLSIRGVAGVAVSENAAFTGFSNGVLVRVGLDDGRPIWRQRLDATGQFQDIDATPVLADGRLYVVVYGSRLVAVDPEDGDLLWSSAVSSHESPIVIEGRVYLGGLDGSVHAFDAATGESQWTRRVSDEPLVTPVYHHGRLYVADARRGLVVLDRDSGVILWRYQGAVSGVRAAPAVDARGGIYLATNLGHLYRFHPIRSR